MEGMGEDSCMELEDEELAMKGNGAWHLGTLY
jgi:hypothetical protein